MGDHDPSGMDMTRNIRERIEQFSGLGPESCRHGDKIVVIGEGRLWMDRIALTREQVDDYGLPPQPVKRTDTMARGYIAEVVVEVTCRPCCPPWFVFKGSAEPARAKSIACDDDYLHRADPRVELDGLDPSGPTNEKTRAGLACPREGCR